MIQQLKPEQEAQLAPWVEQWTKIGLCTDPADRAGAEEGARLAYQAAGLEPPTKFFWLDSPMAGMLVVGALAEVAQATEGKEVGTRLHSVLSAAPQWKGLVSARTASQVRAALAQVWDHVRNQFSHPVAEQLATAEEPPTPDAEQRRAKALSVAFEGVCYGQHAAAWLAYYDFFRVVCGIVECEQLAGLIQVAKSCGWWWPYRDFALMTERPTRISQDAQHRLHHEADMAITYPDGWGVYALHGVQVPAEWVTTPPESLDARILPTIKNAEQRREFVRRIGIERVCRDLNAQVIEQGEDQKGQPCELLLLDTGDGSQRPYIKLRNPSIGVYHIEGVPPECRTLAAAFEFRKPPAMRDLPVSEAGEAWYQQGDVYIWPRQAKALRPRPTLLT